MGQNQWSKWDQQSKWDGSASGDAVVDYFQALSATVILLSDTGITEVGSGVDTWENQGTGNDARQTTDAKRPTVTSSVFGSAPAITFDGSDDFLQIASNSIGAFTIFTCFKVSGTAGVIYVHGEGSGNGDSVYLYGSINDTIQVHESTIGNSGFNRASNWAVDNAIKVTRHRWNGTNASHNFWINGSAPSMTQRNSNNSGTDLSDATLMIGQFDTGALQITGHIGCLIIVPSSMSDADCATAEALLAARGYTA
jgi:hypothetical protein